MGQNQGDRWRRFTRVASYLFVFVFGLLAIVLAGLPELWASALLSLLAAGVLIVVLGVEVGWGYIDLELPTRRDSLAIVATIIGYAVVLVAVTGGVALFSPGVTPADHQVLEPTPTETTSTPQRDGPPASSPAAPETPDAPEPGGSDRFLPLFVTAVIAAPLVEELLFRNGLQKALTGRVGGPVAVLVTSLVFAALHWLSYASSAISALSLAIPLTIIFLTSVLLGLAYWKTENLLVPIAVHAAMNFIAVVASLV